ncbi:GNAT family N-acetyltransferase [Stutzerimonas azotifigens]|uniref:GNAT family N-acetyltransferase n=1 Tax=Stutzerimonas azotifigens TaxID=291995 RepID=UPI0003F6409D|nr:GNAT family N-acetyltransferase [Stutzerimonas azotifigens]
MIRPATPADMERVLAIWLKASLQAHDFIEPAFWEGKLEDMRTHYLPSADVRVYERDGTVLGFCALQENVLAALFVDPEAQGQGIGTALLCEARRLAGGHLELSVYQRNRDAVAFYQRHGFCQIDLRTDMRAGHVELVMLDGGEPPQGKSAAVDEEDAALLGGH